MLSYFVRGRKTVQLTSCFICLNSAALFTLLVVSKPAFSNSNNITVNNNCNINNNSSNITNSCNNYYNNSSNINNDINNNNSSNITNDINKNSIKKGKSNGF